MQLFGCNSNGNSKILMCSFQLNIHRKSIFAQKNIRDEEQFTYLKKLKQKVGDKDRERMKRNVLRYGIVK